MATLPEDGTYPAGVYRIETTDPVVGGPPNEATGAGMINIPLMHLAKRTAWLRAAVTALQAATGAATATVAGIVKLSGSTTSTAADTAASSAAVKTANDNAETRALKSTIISAGGLATGGGDLSAARTITVPVATQAQAETAATTPASADNTGAMTALRVAQFFAALGLPSVANLIAAVADTTAVRSIATGGTGAGTAAGALVSMGLTATAAQINSGLFYTGATAPANPVEGSRWRDTSIPANPVNRIYRLGAWVMELSDLGITANAAQINPLANAFDNAFLGAGATGNLAFGANDFSNPARWVDTVTNGGVTATKSATGMDANGVPWVEYTLNGTVVTLVTLQLFSSAAPFQSATAGQTFTCGGVASLMSGTAAGGLVGARFALYFRNATAGQSEATSSTPVATNTTAITQVVYTAANAATVSVQAAAEIRMPLGAVFTNAVFRFSALQLDRGASRLTYVFKARTAAEARGDLGLPFDANGVLPLSALGFTGSLGATGWRRTPDGLMEQWGSVTTGATGVSVTFPIAFPNAVYTLHVAVNGGAGALMPTFQSQSQSGAFIQAWNTSSVQQSGISVHWRALGR